MGWQDEYKVHPAADHFPMMHGDERFKLEEDIRLHGVKVAIELYDEIDADDNVIETWLIDGRNRLEAAERAGLDIKQILTIRTRGSDPIGRIISLNLRRRHLSSARERAELACALIMMRRGAEDNSRQVGGKIARGRKPGLRAELVAAGKEAGKEGGFSERTAERVIPKLTGRTLKPKPRRSQVEMDRDRFINFLDVIKDGWEIIPEPSDAVLDSMTKDQNASGIAAIKMGEARLSRTRKRMQERYITDK